MSAQAVGAVDEPREDQSLGQQLADLLLNIGEASRFNLITALRAAELNGPGGELIITVPRSSKDRLEVDWVSRQRSLS